MNTNEVLHKEIDLVQNCITRMAQNSFMVKGWLITLLTVVLALLPEKFNLNILCVVGFISIICFWYLDGFFLKLEKLYRWKYEWIITNRPKNNNYLYDLDPYNEKMWQSENNTAIKKEPSIMRVMFTKTLIPMYTSLLVIVMFIFVNSYTNWL